MRATPSVEALAQRAVADGLQSLALTDAGALYGAPAFVRACQEYGVRPLIGMAVRAFDPALDGLGGLLVLLARDFQGYRSLCRLSSALQAAPEREALLDRGLSFEQLRNHREGLLALDAGQQGAIDGALRDGDGRAATRYAGRMAAIFGQDYALGLEIHHESERPRIEAALEIGERLGLLCAALQPVYYMAREEQPRLRLLAAIAANTTLEGVPAQILPDRGDPARTLHWLSPQEISERFEAWPQALAACAELAARLGPVLPDGRQIWPAPALPAGVSAQEALREDAYQGLRERYAPFRQAEAQKRLEHELQAIGRDGLAPFFIVIADAVAFARQEAIPVSTRGSVANSLVAYCLKITSVDPLAYDLLFERFLNPARSSPPDIDLDFCSRRRDRVLEYLRQKYGRQRMAMIGTMTTLQLRSAFREVGKAYGLGEAQLRRLAARAPRRRERPDLAQALQELDEPVMREVARQAFELLGYPHHLSVHPGGVVLTPGELTDWVPLQHSPKGFVITQFDQRDLERLGLPKFDLLGIRALTVLADTVEMLRRARDPEFDLQTIPPDDAKTAALLSAGDTIGVFQCESEGARRTLRRLRARNLADLAIANAFFKPGPSTGGMAEAFVRRYRGDEEASFLHPSLEPILAPTKGVLIFQEQVLRLATEVAGLDWAQADHLRRGMSKFLPQEMAEIEAQFIAGCMRPAPQGPGIPKGVAQTLWDQVQAFSGYGFNQGHATAYADVSYRSAYLKAHHPAAFLCARLADRGGFHHPAIYIAEARRLGIQVRAPHINHSNRQFTLEWQAGQAILWMGLGQVRDLRRSACAEIVAQRRRRAFMDLRDLLRRVTLQPKESRHLIRCGALDGLAPNRASQLAELVTIERAGSAAQLPFDFAAPPPGASESLQGRFAWEQELLGMPLSVDPLQTLDTPPPAGSLLDLCQSDPGAGRSAPAYRLPGWTGTQGFYLSDGSILVPARSRASNPPPVWQPQLVRGHWRTQDGGGWLEIEALQRLV